jgi:hypothetical protein
MLLKIHLHFRSTVKSWHDLVLILAKLLRDTISFLYIFRKLLKCLITLKIRVFGVIDISTFAIKVYEPIILCLTLSSLLVSISIIK